MAAAAVLALLLLGGCPPRGGKQNGTVPDENVALAQGGSLSLPLTIAHDAPPLASLDLSDPALWALARCIELPLMYASAAGESIPGAASNCSSADGGRTWTLSMLPAPGKEAEPGYLGQKLIDNWQQILRATDSPLKAQLSDLLEGGLSYAQGQGESVSGLSLSGNTLSITLTRPYQQFPLWLSQPGLGIMENRKLPASSADAPAGGWGPFKVVSFAEKKITLEPNPDTKAGTPLLDSLSFLCEPDRLLQVELFRGGVLDAANVPMLMVPDIAADPELAASLQQVQTACQIVGSFDHHQFPWGDQEFQPKTGLRQALNWGLSRGLMSEVFNEQFSPWPHFLPEVMKQEVDPALVSSPSFPNHQLIEEARASLKQADHEQGGKLLPGMDLCYLRESDLDQLADEMLHYWNEISVKMEPFPVTREELRTRLELGTTEIVLERLQAAYPSPDALFYPNMYGPLAHRSGRADALVGTGGNHSLLDDAQINGQIEAIQAEKDELARRKLFQQLGKTIEEQALYVIVGSATPSLLLGQRLGGHKLNAYDFDASLPGQDFAKLGVRAGAGGSEEAKQASAGGG